MSIVWGGNVCSYSGHDKLGKHIIKGMKRKPVLLESTQSDIIKLVERGCTITYRFNGDLNVNFTNPPFYLKPERGKSIGFIVCETTGVPDAWRKKALEQDAVFAPSNFVRNSYGLTRKECETFFFCPDPIKSVPIIERDHDECIFLYVGQDDDRKNVSALITAFRQEFEHDTMAQLWLKLTHYDHSPGYLVLSPEMKRKSTDRIRVFNQILTEEQLGTLYSLADCYVHPSCGEGNEQPTLEAMSAGCQVIATDFSSMQEHLKGTGAKLVDCDVVPASPKWVEDVYFDKDFVTHWGAIRVDDLRKKMREVYENPVPRKRVKAVYNRLRAMDETDKFEKWLLLLE